ncbi:MAG: glutaredoxin [Spirochaetales bacterium]|nr:glutaredoxin [Spirochaetales bacterium]
MMDTSIFTRFEGSKSDKDLVFLGLSTCGFCKRAKAFLEEEDYAFSFVDIDKLDRDVRMSLKDDVKKRFTPDILYPMLIIDDADFLTGFKKDHWLEKLG